MSVTAVIGTQWGDEGKGKIVDVLAQKANFIIRANGGDNAGHTINNQYGEFKLHLVPSGIFNAKSISIIGNGVALNPDVLVREMGTLKQAGIEISSKNLILSPRAHLIMPWHIWQDRAEESARSNGKIGTTLRGIGPCFADKAARKGIRMGEMVDPRNFADKCLALYDEKTKLLNLFYQWQDFTPLEKILDDYLRCGRLLAPYVRDIEPTVWQAIAKNKNILLEGAQGQWLDIDYGTYPFVTSSFCTVAGLAQGAGVPPDIIQTRIGVVKAYVTRVGAGHFLTEMQKDFADAFREKAREFGATTGRPRRIGWFDAVIVRYAAKLNNLNALALTRLDTLTGIPEIKIANAHKLGRKVSLDFPLWEGKPIYEELPGWEEPIEGCQKFSDLPKYARDYVLRIQELVGVQIKYISTGPKREDMIVI